jgi:amino acid transporter
MLLDEKQKSFLKRFVPVAAFVGGLCCFTPVVLVLLGISTVTFAASLSDVLYGTHRWAFRGVALLFLFIALFWYFYRHEKVCTMEELKKKRRRIINFVLITLIITVILYIVWLYVIVEIIGVVLGIWG